MPEFHNVLQRQIKKTLGDSFSLTPELEALLGRVSEAYGQFDNDRKLIERSLELSSQEMMEINKDIEAKVVQRTEELRQEHSRFVSSINSIDIGFLMCDRSGQVILSNPAVCKIIKPGEEHTDTPQLQHIDAFLEEDVRLASIAKDVMSTGKPAAYPEVQAGIKILRLYIAPVANEADPSNPLGTVIVIEDITERKVIERSKDEFFSIASHELRTPLTAIRGNTEMIEKYFAEHLKDKDLADMVADIHGSAVRLIEIVNDFLDLSGLEQGKVPFEPSAISIKSIVDTVMYEMANISQEKGISLAADASLTDAPQVYADKARIKQVVYNLVGNAMKFTEQGSVSVKAERQDGFLKVSVVDTGRGISEENQQLLFRKFQQAGSSLITRDTTKGTGLGLYISKLIVEKSGGSIQLEGSTESKGSTFSFTLPIAGKMRESSS